MTSERKIEANRQNAQLSTGPRTDEGKAVVARNALRHGLTAAKELCLDRERKADLLALREKMHDEMRPATELESLLVDRIVTSLWRLRRVLRIETDILEGELFKPPYGRPGRRNLGEAFAAAERGSEDMTRLTRYEAAIERGLFKAMDELRKLQATRQAEPEGCIDV